MRKHLYIGVDGKKLYCCYSSPDKRATNIGVLIVQPFAEERILMQRSLFNLANDLTNSGISVCRFDFLGQGDSEGDFKEASIIEWQSNLQGAIKSFKNELQLDEIILCGFRLGATLAMLATKDHDELHRIILVDPIMNGQRYIEGVLRTNLAYQMVTFGEIKETRNVLIERLLSGEYVNIDGYQMSGEFFQQICSINLINHSIKDKNILILNYSRKNDHLPRSLVSYRDYLRESNCRVFGKSIPDPTAWKASELYNMNLCNTSREITNWINTSHAEIQI